MLNLVREANTSQFSGDLRGILEYIKRTTAIKLNITIDDTKEDYIEIEANLPNSDLYLHGVFNIDGSILENEFYVLKTSEGRTSMAFKEVEQFKDFFYEYNKINEAYNNLTTIMENVHNSILY